MDDILAPLQDAFEGQIDFHGQRLAELLSTALLIIFGAISFVIGYLYKDIHLTLWVGLGGTLFTGLVVIPPWPFYNMNPEMWLPSRKAGPSVLVDGVKVD
ncbi:Microsomal signal peptidase Spc12 [Penicillium argentinense]|uniref:Signal peptidase complex subunit 1 n=1 Tax=Penicillium argentinense TaxID=1131581 RepID=A0A9W9F7N9_9EURO|nr:Microsomal signal peptidase Spc12 [Penicillium argentinense]KAJ5095127.1 Microsomal signal peptidase Spc12 [Penicillium argentinense]